MGTALKGRFNGICINCNKYWGFFYFHGYVSYDVVSIKDI